ncbi:MAG: SMC-Scp complex subunit ScpB [Rhodococcus sp. (in: high G+C Gram-positive bacteria)]|uniref:SMC-Scp complex subunit ScpB n=1 Tax=Rhodococcus sp. TaxID=1831 RepID=UPI003D9BF82F
MSQDHVADAAGTADERAWDAELLEMADDELVAALEALLLVVDTPAPTEQLAAAIGVTTERAETALRGLAQSLTARGSGIDLRIAGDGWRFYTRRDFAPYVEKLLQGGARTKLTRAALETLAVVAYRQPVTRSRVSAVRGVNVDGVMRTLLARDLIAEAGTDRETGGTLYVTTDLFLERLGLASLQVLPPVGPLLPDVDVIDDISESLESDPRFERMGKNARPETLSPAEFDPET